MPTRVAALGTGRAVADLALRGNPADAGYSWSVVQMGGGGIEGESLYRWGLLYVLNGVEPMEEGGLGRLQLIPGCEGSPVEAWPWALGLGTEPEV